MKSNSIKKTMFPPINDVSQMSMGQYFKWACVWTKTYYMQVFWYERLIIMDEC